MDANNPRDRFWLGGSELPNGTSSPVVSLAGHFGMHTPCCCHSALAGAGMKGGGRQREGWPPQRALLSTEDAVQHKRDPNGGPGPGGHNGHREVHRAPPQVMEEGPVQCDLQLADGIGRGQVMKKKRVRKRAAWMFPAYSQGER